MLAVPGAGECEAVSVPLEDDRPLHLVVARRADEPFQTEELGLLRGMGRVLTLGLRNLRLLENERALRSGSERQASENARLLGALRERQVLLERLAQLQRGIVDRLPVHEVLEAARRGRLRAAWGRGRDPAAHRSRRSIPYHAGRLDRRRRGAAHPAPASAGRRGPGRARDA